MFSDPKPFTGIAPEDICGGGCLVCEVGVIVGRRIEVFRDHAANGGLTVCENSRSASVRYAKHIQKLYSSVRPRNNMFTYK